MYWGHNKLYIILNGAFKASFTGLHCETVSIKYIGHLLDYFGTRYYNIICAWNYLVIFYTLVQEISHCIIDDLTRLHLPDNLSADATKMSLDVKRAWIDHLQAHKRFKTLTTLQRQTTIQMRKTMEQFLTIQK